MTVLQASSKNDDPQTSSSSSSRQRFLKSKRRQSLQQYSIVLYLVALMTVLLGLQTTVGDSLLYSLFAYIITSSFVVLVCATQSRCCSAHRTVYRPIPPCIGHHRHHNSPQSSKDLEYFCAKDHPHHTASLGTSDVIFVIHDGGVEAASSSPDNHPAHHHQFALTPAEKNLLTPCRR